MLRACKLAKPWRTIISTTINPRQHTTVQSAAGSHKHIHIHSSSSAYFRTHDNAHPILANSSSRRSYISLPSSFTALVQQVWEMIELHTKVRKKQRKALILKLRQNTLTNISMKSIRHNMEFARTRAKSNMEFARTRANLYYNAKVRRQRYLYESTVEHTKQMQVQSKDRWRKWLKQAKGKEKENDDDDTASVLLEVEIDDVNGDYKRVWFDEDGFPRTSRDKNGRFVNPWSVVSSTPPFSSFLRWRRERWMDSYAPASLREPQSLEERQQFLPIVTSCNASSAKKNKKNIEFQWIGHSTCLVQMDDFTILTDPVFSNHAAPIPAGVPRFTPPALNLEQLQEKHIDAVVISHDHYDHLDVHSLREIEDRGLMSEQGKYFVPLGHKHYIMRTCGIAADKICELEWWQSSTIQKHSHELKISCAPAQHWCSRTPFDRNLRLWCSWAFRSTTSTSTSTSEKSFYFAGDTGVPDNFPLHEQIGERLGPFDLAALPIGAYAPNWFMKESHCAPHETVQIHRAIRARYSVGVHWGTWALADEPYFEPPRLLREACASAGDGLVFGRDMLVVRHGERVEFPCSDDDSDGVDGHSNEEMIVDPHPVLLKE
mmetsp:Transcript_26443/g.40961  ORF Transcript_26443/g.40961 Transcript_26443/m.40961 type:complete len:602 (-) Transcript_26443:126-1931(-)